VASDEQRKEAAERHTASRWASKRTPDNEKPPAETAGGWGGLSRLKLASDVTR